jgi:hypothetical protein
MKRAGYNDMSQKSWTLFGAPHCSRLFFMPFLAGYISYFFIFTSVKTSRLSAKNNHHSISAKRIIAAREVILVRLRELQGIAWKEVQGELHLPEAEMPTWILLYTDNDVAVAHEHFREIISPYINELPAFNFSVSYRTITANKEVVIYFGDQEEIFSDVFTEHESAITADTLKIFNARDSHRD